MFAGLWEGWKDPANDEWIHTCTIITGEPNEFVGEIHTRMPVILSEEHHEDGTVVVPRVERRLSAGTFRTFLE